MPRSEDNKRYRPEEPRRPSSRGLRHEREAYHERDARRTDDGDRRVVSLRNGPSLHWLDLLLEHRALDGMLNVHVQGKTKDVRMVYVTERDAGFAFDVFSRAIQRRKLSGTVKQFSTRIPPSRFLGARLLGSKNRNPTLSATALAEEFGLPRDCVVIGLYRHAGFMCHAMLQFRSVGEAEDALCRHRRTLKTTRANFLIFEFIPEDVAREGPITQQQRGGRRSEDGSSSDSSYDDSTSETNSLDASSTDPHAQRRRRRSPTPLLSAGSPRARKQPLPPPPIPGVVAPTGQNIGGRRARSPSGSVASTATDEWSTAGIRRRFNSPSRNIAFKRPDAIDDDDDVRTAVNTQLPGANSIALSEDICFVNFATNEEARAALVGARGVLRTPWRGDQITSKLFFTKPRNELPENDTLMLSNLDARVADATLVSLFPGSIGITRIDKLRRAFLRFRSVRAALDTLAEFRPGVSASLADEAQLTFAHRGATEREWHVILRGVSAVDHTLAFQMVSRCVGYRAAHVIMAPLFLINCEFASEVDARRAVTALTGRTIGSSTAIAEAHWCCQQRGTRSPQLHLTQIAVNVSEATLLAALQPYQVLEFRMKSQAGGYAWFRSEEEAEGALTSLRGVPIAGCAPPQIDFAFPPRPLPLAGAPMARSVSPAPQANQTGLLPTPKKELQLPDGGVPLPPIPGGLPLAAAASSAAAAAETPAGDDPAVLYERHCPGQDMLPPGWTVKLGRTEEEVTVLDHISRLAGPAEGAEEMSAALGRQLLAGIDHAVDCVPQDGQVDVAPQMLDLL